LESVFEKTQGVEFEVFVVDNNSQDGSCEMIEQEFPQVRLIKNKENKGFGAANNIAIGLSKAKYVFLLNTDTILVNNAVKILFDFMEKEENKNVAACGGTLLNENFQQMTNGGHFPSLKGVLFKLGLRNIFKKYYDNHLNFAYPIISESIKEVDYITGADLFLRKSVLNKVGAFDEDFFMYFEEVDLCKRIKNEGFDIKFIPDSQIIHLEGKSNNKNLKRKEQSKISECLYFRKHKGLLGFLALKILYIILYLIEFLIKHNTDSLKLICIVIKS
jgi:GT2 family glycosyltransferase